MSKTNREEAVFILNLLQHLYMNFANKNVSQFKDRIGAITPYKAQVRLIKDLVGNWVRSLPNPQPRLTDLLEVNTVDAFQGREKDIIIISCVRSNSSASLKGSLGFLVDARRMNVAITRAKHLLFLVGNSETLSKNEHWRGMIKECGAGREQGMIKYSNPQAYSLNSLKD